MEITIQIWIVYTATDLTDRAVFIIPEKYSFGILPWWISDNVYVNGARFFSQDKNLCGDPSYDPEIRLEEKGSEIFLHIKVHPSFPERNVSVIDTKTLVKAKIPKAWFDNPDGSQMTIDKDSSGNKRAIQNNLPGPISNLTGRELLIKVW